MTDENSEIDKIIKVVIDEYKNNDNDNAEIMFKIILKKLGIDEKQYKQSDYKLKYEDKLSVINSKLQNLDYKSSDDKSSDDAAKYINLILTIKQEDQEKHLKSRFPELELGNNTADKFPPPDVDDNTDATRRELSKLAIPDDKEEEEEKSNQASSQKSKEAQAAAFAKKLVAEENLDEKYKHKKFLENMNKYDGEEEEEDEDYFNTLQELPAEKVLDKIMKKFSENKNGGEEEYEDYFNTFQEPQAETPSHSRSGATVGEESLIQSEMLRAPSPTARNDEKRMVEEMVEHAKKPSDRKYDRKYAWAKTPSQTETPSQPYLGSISRVKNHVENIDRRVKERGRDHIPHILSEGGGTLKRRKPKKKISRKKYYKVARNTKRKLNKKNKNTRKIYT